jgi:glycosyltransferase involved in cell wall biosynthesis
VQRSAAHRQCLDSLLAQDLPPDRCEIVVVDGMSDDGTRERVREHAARHPRIRLVDNPARTTPIALNTGIRDARGDVIVRADAHVLYPTDYVRRLVEALEETGADNVGGVLATIPANDGPVARGIAVAMAHPLGVGNSTSRIGTKEPLWTPSRSSAAGASSSIAWVLRRGPAAPQDAEFNSACGPRAAHPPVPAVVALYAATWQVARMFTSTATCR